MRGWLIVNSFVDSEKFFEIYDLIREQALSRDIEMEIKRTDQLMCSVQSDFKDLDLPDFSVFWDKDILLARRLEEAGVSLLVHKDGRRLCSHGYHGREGARPRRLRRH